MTFVIDSFRFEAAEFSPEDIAGLDVWLDVSQLIGFVNDDPVTSWTDMSGNGHHGIAEVGGGFVAAKYKTNIINGLPCIKFENDNTEYRLNPAPFSSGGGTGFVVLKLTVETNNYGLWRTGSNGDPTFYPHTSGNIYDQFGSTARRNADPTPSLINAHVYSVLSNTNDWRAFINGTVFITDAVNTIGWSTSYWPIGSNGAGYFLNGHIGEILIYNAALSDPDRVLVESYLIDKWAI